MDTEEFREFLTAEIEEIKRFRWIESEKAEHDVGKDAELEWVSLFAVSFREWWDCSHHCMFFKTCKKQKKG